MALFGTSTSKLLRYLAPLEAADLVEYGFSTLTLEELLEEKAEIVYSYLPERYRCFFANRVHRLVLVEFAYADQDTASVPFVGMANVTGYLNPTGELEDLPDSESIACVVDDGLGVITFPDLDLGDMIVIDFDLDMDDIEIRPLSWASNVLAAADIMSSVAGDTKTANVLPRVKNDLDRIFPWLGALNSPSLDDRVVIKTLEYLFWTGTSNFSKRLDTLQKRLTER